MPTFSVNSNISCFTILHFWKSVFSRVAAFSHFAEPIQRKAEILKFQEYTIP